MVHRPFATTFSSSFWVAFLATQRILLLEDHLHHTISICSMEQQP